MSLVRMADSGDACWDVKEMPHKQEFDALVKRLPKPKYDKICAKLNELIDAALREKTKIFISSWMPGHNWSVAHGGVFDVLYEIARCDLKLAAMFFGRILQHVVIERDEKWMTTHIDPLAKGLCYWRLYE